MASMTLVPPAQPDDYLAHIGADDFVPARSFINQTGDAAGERRKAFRIVNDDEEIEQCDGN